MRLAETITLEIAGQGFTLRPTLRAAVLLERAHGLDELGERLIALHASAIADTIAATADGAHDPDDIVASMIRDGLAATAMRLVPDLLELLVGLAGIDPDAEEKQTDKQTPRPIAEVHRELYRIGTGKIGWTPAETWEATPLEIIEAWRGRIELLGDIFGRAEEKPAPGKLDDKISALIQRNQALASAMQATA